MLRWVRMSASLLLQRSLERRDQALLAAMRVRVARHK
jgi:hypothetical protein